MNKQKSLYEPVMNVIENANATDKGRFISDCSLDVVICDPPLFTNTNDKTINNWLNEQDYLQWFKIFMNIVSSKLKKTGIFYLIGEIDDLHKLIAIIEEFDFELTMTYYFTKDKRAHSGKKSKDQPRTTKIIESVFIFTRNFQNKVKKILKLKQAEYKMTSKDINIRLSGNGNGGGYWSLYCGENSKNAIPSHEHWVILKEMFNLEIDYDDIVTQFKQYEGTNLWDDFDYEDDKLLSGINRPVAFFERLLQMNRRELAELVVWDPFCGYGNSTKAFKKLNINFYANEFDLKIYYKAMINIGSSVNLSRPVIASSIVSSERM